MEVGEPNDICCICNAVQDSGTMMDVNEVDFELLCKECEHKRCHNCANLEFDLAFGEHEYKCLHQDHIEDPKNKICEYWEEE